MIFLRITKVSGKRLEFVTEQARLRTSPQRRNDQGGRVGAAVRGRPARQALLPAADSGRPCEDRQVYVSVNVTTMSLALTSKTDRNRRPPTCP